MISGLVGLLGFAVIYEIALVTNRRRAAVRVQRSDWWQS